MPVDDGVVIINEATARVCSDGGPETLIEGTHLVTFEQTATINGSQFVNLRTATGSCQVATTQHCRSRPGAQHRCATPDEQRKLTLHPKF